MKADIRQCGWDAREVPIADVDHKMMVPLDICRHPATALLKGRKEAFCIFRKRPWYGL
jgi:hypothetical protein